MRIVFFGDGSLNHVRRWVSYFHARGHEVLLLSFEDVSECPFPARRLRAHLPTKLLGYLSALPELRREIAGFRPDLMNALYLGGYGFVAAASGFRPLAVSSLGSDLLVDYPSSFIHRRQIRSCVRRADLVVTDADELSRIAISIGARRETVLKAYMGIDETVFHPRAASAPPPDVSTGDRPRVASTRNLYPVYDLDLLVDAAPLVREKRDASFVVCGDGPERERLERKVKRLGLEKHFTFRGRLSPEDIADELRRTDVYVSTSKSDSTSVSLLEAMACGATPVVTDIPANREWITDGENGLVVRTRDGRALAEAVLRALESSGFRTQVRERNLAVIRERGLWSANMARVEEAFRRLAEARTSQAARSGATAG